MTTQKPDLEFESTVAALTWLKHNKPAVYGALHLLLMVQEERPELKQSECVAVLLGACLEADTRAALEDMFVTFRTAELNQAGQHSND